MSGQIHPLVGVTSAGNWFSITGWFNPPMGVILATFVILKKTFNHALMYFKAKYLYRNKDVLQ